MAFCSIISVGVLCASLSEATGERESGEELGRKVTVVKRDIETIVRSPIDFVYERPDQKDLVEFKNKAKLDEVIGEGSDFEKLVRLMDWVGSLHNDRKTKAQRAKDGHYLWGVDSLVSWDDSGNASVSGHCMSYAAVMIDACTALGFKARHFAVEGFRDMCHEVVEVWVPSMGKWVYFDPSLTQYYKDLETGEPLNMLEMHRIVVKHFLPEGKNMSWFSKRKNPATREVVRRVGGQKPVAVRQGRWHYGKPVEEDYEWGWRHGYLAAGFLQMTPRNDFNSNPDANPGNFGHRPGYADYPFWVDEKTPARKGSSNTISKESDFYWTLDQAAFEIEAVEEKTGAVNLKLENSMPFFSHYEVIVDGKTIKVEDSSFEWKLGPEENAINVFPVDIFGQRGAGSSAVVYNDSIE